MLKWGKRGSDSPSAPEKNSCPWREKKTIFQACTEARRFLVEQAISAVAGLLSGDTIAPSNLPEGQENAGRGAHQAFGERPNFQYLFLLFCQLLLAAHLPSC